MKVENDAVVSVQRPSTPDHSRFRKTLHALHKQSYGTVGELQSKRQGRHAVIQWTGEHGSICLVEILNVEE